MAIHLGQSREFKLELAIGKWFIACSRTRDMLKCKIHWIIVGAHLQEIFKRIGSNEQLLVPNLSVGEVYFTSRHKNLRPALQSQLLMTNKQCLKDKPDTYI